MQLSTFYKNYYETKIPVLKLLILLFSLFVVNYYAKTVSENGSTLVIIFVVLEVMLLLIDPVFGFAFAIAANVDIMGYFADSHVPDAAFVSMFYVFIFNKKLSRILAEDSKLKKLTLLSLILTAYLFIVNVGMKNGYTSESITISLGYVFGFLAILPAYYFAITKPRELFLCLITITAACLFLYYLDSVKNLGIFKLEVYMHLEESTMERKAGYDIRQFMIFFAYLIPAVMASVNMKNLHKQILLGLGLLSFVVLVMAFYRLAMFYVIMGGVLSYYFIKKYAEVKNLFKYFIAACILLIIASLFFGNYLTEIKNLYQITVDYFSGKGHDASADARFETQLPVLTQLFFNNPFTGAGVINLLKQFNVGMMGFVDFPILGTLAAYGIIGMAMHYFKFYYLLSNTRKDMDMEFHDPFLVFFYLTLKAYFITMITFRFFYISWELTFDYLQIEFGLFAGVFLALGNILGQNEFEDD